MIPSLSNLGTVIGAVAGGLAVLGLSTIWTQLVTVPAVKAETRAVVEAEAERRTFDAINAVADSAERARAVRRYCAGRGLLYDFAANKCRS